MKCELVKGGRRIVAVKEMNDGDLGVIVEHTHGPYLGRVVHCFGERLLSVGLQRGESWRREDTVDAFRVELLQPGDTIVIR